MSNDRVGTGGSPSARPDGGSSRRRGTSWVPQGRGPRAFLAAGLALVLVSLGIVVSRAADPVQTRPSASADTQAGNLVDAGALVGATSAAPDPGAPAASSTASPGPATLSTPMVTSPVTPTPPASAGAAPTAGAAPSTDTAPTADTAPSTADNVPSTADTAPGAVSTAPGAVASPGGDSSTQATPDGAAPRSTSPGSVRSGAAAGDTTPMALAAAQPFASPAVAIHIPRLGVDQSMIALHVQADRSLSVPKRFSDIGWWSEGPQPATPGAVIVGGHVSSKSGPGVFFRLKDMRRGDLVRVDRADGTTAVFQVRGLASYPRNNYPNEIVYRASGKASLHLITCDGAFDPTIGHHEDNLVVFADLVASGPTKEKAA